MIRILVNTRAAPQGSKRSLGPGIMVESSKRVRPYREAVRYAVLESDWDRVTLDGPLHVDLVFAFVPPKSAKRGSRPITRSSGDIDKLCRSTLDALTDVGLIADDSRITHLRASKVHAETCHVSIHVEEAP